MFSCPSSESAAKIACPDSCRLRAQEACQDVWSADRYA
jgi:hypothetical protein